MIKGKIQSIKNTVENLSFYTEYDYIEKIKELLIPLYDSNDYESIKYNSIIRIPNLPKNSSDEAKKIKKEIGELLKSIQEFTTYTEEEIKNSILQTKKYGEIISEIILKFDEKVNAFKYENGAYEFIDISKMAIKILCENENVRLELKNKYKEILIDEYQDTNDIQDLFVSQIENNNVYMVGDVKQSIYRFRNANPMLFKEKYDNYSNNNGGMKIDLNKNFRSREEVTNNINLIFNLIMNDNIGGADYLTSHQMIFGNTAYNDVNNENYNMDVLNYTVENDSGFSKEEIEIFAIARDIQDKVNNHYKIMDKETNEECDISYGDFVILMDRSSSFSNYKKIFEYLNIPLSIYRDDKISDSIDIMIIKNLYNLIISINEKNYNTMFKYSFMSIARSYLFSMPDDEILEILNDKKYYETDIYKKCKDISNDLGTLNNKEIFERIITDFDFYNKIIECGDVNKHLLILNSISKVIDNVSNFGYSPKMFLNYLNEISNNKLDINLSLNKETSNSVKIMTIHASKGLEYHICYFSGLYRKFNISDLKEKFYFSNDYGIITPFINKGIRTTILKTLLKQKYIYEEISEKLRLFYVALTRAREKMILVGSFEPNLLSFKTNGVVNDETRSNYLSFNDMLNSVYNYLTPYMKNIDINNLNMTKDYNFTKTTNYKNFLKQGKTIDVIEYNFDTTKIINDRFSKNVHDLYTKEEKSNIDLGLRMHYLFEMIDFKKRDYSNINDYEKKKIMSFINCGILDGYINLYKEYEFTYEEENTLMHGFIDLLIEYKDRFAIVDYKLKNTTDKAYLKQLKGYKNYIESITNKNVETYLYSIIDEKLVNLD